MAGISAALLLLVVAAISSWEVASGSSCICTREDYAGYLPPQPANPCIIGPSFWCKANSNNIARCNLESVKSIGNCHYGSAKCPVVADVATFCKTEPSALTYYGGMTNIPPGLFGYLALALYWAPTSCLSNQTTGGGFCSSYTTKGKIGAQRLVLHGLWPDYGSLYGVGGTPPPPPASQKGAYQGWSQYCSAANYPGAVDFSKCHANGPLCPENTTTQTDYEICMRKHNVTACLVEESVVDALKKDFEAYAPGHLGADRTFLDHEFSKHGSCMETYFVKNKTAYFEASINLAKSLRVQAPAKLVHASRGRSIKTSLFVHSMRKTSVPRCNKLCQLSEIWYCYGRDAEGFPTELIRCPPGTLASDNCSPGIVGSNNCTSVIIPDFEKGPNKAP
eukprot:jgi/Mesen1/6428/ME000329S05583